MKCFLDTNIIVDFIVNREPFNDAAQQLFHLAAIKKISLFTSSHSIATVHYLCKKNFKEAEVRKILEDTLDFITVIPVTINILKKSLKSVHKDFEDAIQIFCAHEIRSLGCIVTRNVKDFSTAEIPVYSSDEILQLVNKK